MEKSTKVEFPPNIHPENKSQNDINDINEKTLQNNIKEYPKRTEQLLASSTEEACQQQPPEGWLTMSQLAKLLHTNAYKIKEFVKKYRMNHPDWFQNFKTKRIAEYFHPKLVKEAKGHFSELYPYYPNPPEGWYTVNGLSKIVGTSSITITNFVKKYRMDHPSWFQNFKIKQIAEYFHPKLVEIIQKHFSRE